MKPNGLKPTPHDPRDYSYEKTFGGAVSALPDEYFVDAGQNRKILSQGLTMMCTAFATSVAATAEDNVDFCPEWFFAQEKEISGSGANEGEDLRTPMQTAVKSGFCPLATAPFTLADKDAAFLSTASSWPYSCVLAASPYRKQGFFRVDGNFAAIRQVLYQNRQFRRAIITGVNWRGQWIAAPGGVVPATFSPNDQTSGHCIAIIGFTKKNGEDVIAIQDSDSEAVGDRGLFYFNETVFNREFTFPMYMLVRLPQDTAPAPIGSWLEILFFNLKKLLQ